MQRNLKEPKQNRRISHANVRHCCANQMATWSRADSRSSVKLCSDLYALFSLVCFSSLSPFTCCKDYIMSLISLSRSQTSIKLINFHTSQSHIGSWMLLYSCDIRSIMPKYSELRQVRIKKKKKTDWEYFFFYCPDHWLFFLLILFWLHN